MNRCMYCGKIAPKMSLICDSCAQAITELPKEKERKCGPFPWWCACDCKEC